MVRFLFSCVLVSMLTVGLGQAAASGDSFAWVQYGPDGLEARATTREATCPAALVDGAPLQLVERSAPNAAYPVRGCALRLPPATKALAVEGQALPLPKARPDRILIIGDTGCRMKGEIAQACNDPTDWPFRRMIAQTASLKPDLVLHVGDMHYRETPCPAAQKGCQGSPYGDNWEVWKADFFDPAETLLHAAPWILVRGNHEDCRRGGKGWTRLLDPYPFDPAQGAEGCLPTSPLFTVDLHGVTLAVMDVSTAAEREDAEQVKWYQAQFEQVKSIDGPVWIALHRPLWALEEYLNGRPIGDNATLARAARESLSPQVKAFLSGHHHAFEALTYKEDLPAQIVSGHGGDELAMHIPPITEGMVINGVTIAEATVRMGVFGFSMMERVADDASGEHWKLTSHDINGSVLATCDLNGRKLSCR